MSFQFHFHDFANLCTTKNHSIDSPEFTCNGHQWELRIYPGGKGEAAEGTVSAYLNHRSKGRITTSYIAKIIDKFGEIAMEGSSPERRTFDGDSKSWGFPNFISRSTILNESNNILDHNGTLTVVVSIEVEPTTVFVPKNPLVRMMQKMFNDETTADVCFEVSAAKGTEDDDAGTKRIKATTPFYAHRTILQGCAPMLAATCGSKLNDSGGKVIASVNDVKPDIFHHLLFYVYGGSVPKNVLEEHTKDIIDAADKYSIVNLKLEAETAYVENTKLTFDNAMDNLLYADSRNCALLKETVVNFLAEKHIAAAANISFADFPGHIVKDLLIAVGRNNNKEANAHGITINGWNAPCVSALRRYLNKMGLEFDGSREAMIESIRSNSGSIVG